MLTDPLFILGFIGMAICLFSWIKFSIEKNEVEPFVIRYISSISLISGLALLLSIFYNSGDLGIVLLFGSLTKNFGMPILCTLRPYANLFTNKKSPFFNWGSIDPDGIWYGSYKKVLKIKIKNIGMK